MSDSSILNSYSLLIVDDEEQVRILLYELLKPYLKKIYSAANGKDALTIFNNKRPDIILTDVVMPHRNGLDFIDEIRRAKNTPPIVIMTAYRQKETLLKILRATPDALLLKPVSVDVLLEALTKVAREISLTYVQEFTLPCRAIVNIGAKTIEYRGKLERLAPKEVALLVLCRAYKGGCVPYAEIERSVWAKENDVMTENSLKSLVYRIRQKSCKEILKIVPKTGIKEGI